LGSIVGFKICMVTILHYFVMDHILKLCLNIVVCSDWSEQVVATDEHRCWHSDVLQVDRWWSLLAVDHFVDMLTMIILLELPRKFQLDEMQSLLDRQGILNVFNGKEFGNQILEVFWHIGLIYCKLFIEVLDQVSELYQTIFFN